MLGKEGLICGLVAASTYQLLNIQLRMLHFSQIFAICQGLSPSCDIGLPRGWMFSEESGLLWAGIVVKPIGIPPKTAYPSFINGLRHSFSQSLQTRMHLLNVHSLKVEWFKNDRDRPPYAILSHTWGDDEVSFQDLRNPLAKSMAGYSKIAKCCDIAIQDGFDYVWIDTCCIDKTSSAELSEAINSMYQWYQSAKVCYAYLSDVGGEHNPRSSFAKSQWFTRGWTLQELLAPDIVVFYNSAWVPIGTRRSLQASITRVTGIPREALVKEAGTQTGTETFSIATRMSWAANRQTTRVEDVAYCLLGVFGVNMPPLYGEGGVNAFMRLQGEIMKGSDDQSLFAWMLSDGRALKVGGGMQDGVKGDWEGEILAKMWCPDRYDFWEVGLLAPSPEAFAHMRNVHCLVPATQPSFVSTTLATKPFAMTNAGLHIWLPLVGVHSDGNYEICQARLDCDIADGNGCLTIFLRRHPASGHCTRILSTALCTTVLSKFERAKPVEIYVRGTYPRSDQQESMGFWGRCLPAVWSSYHLRLAVNDSPRTGYTTFLTALNPEFAQKREICFSSSVSVSRTGNGMLGDVNVSYFVVQARCNTAVHALVIVGVSFGTRTLFCAVRSGKEEEEDRIRHICASSSSKLEAPPLPSGSGSTQQPTRPVDGSSIDTIFPNANAVIPGESIIEDISDGLCICVTFRASPSFPPTWADNPVSCVVVEFMPSPSVVIQRRRSALSLGLSRAGQGADADADDEDADEVEDDDEDEEGEEDEGEGEGEGERHLKSLSLKDRRNRRPESITLSAVA